jgi:hypothetical protein
MLCRAWWRRRQLRRGSNIAAHNNALQGMTLISRILFTAGNLVPRTAALSRPRCYHGNTPPQR